MKKPNIQLYIIHMLSNNLIYESREDYMTVKASSKKTYQSDTEGTALQIVNEFGENKIFNILRMANHG